MSIARTIGFHLQKLLNDHELNIETFAEEMGFSLKEMYLILEGRIFIPPFVLKEFATYFKVTPDYFLKEYRKEDSLPEHTYLFQFSNSEHIDIILDLIDTYADLKEMCT